MIRKVIRFALWTIAIVCLCTVTVFVLVLFGLFGQQEDAFSAVLLALAGQPWIMFSSFLPPALLPWAGLLAPVLNLILIWIALRVFFDW